MRVDSFAENRLRHPPHVFPGLKKEEEETENYEEIRSTCFSRLKQVLRTLPLALSSLFAPVPLYCASRVGQFHWFQAFNRPIMSAGRFVDRLPRRWLMDSKRSFGECVPERSSGTRCRSFYYQVDTRSPRLVKNYEKILM